MTQITQACLAVALMAMGFIGLYFKIEYSGWALVAAMYVLCNMSEQMDRDDDPPKN